MPDLSRRHTGEPIVNLDITAEMVEKILKKAKTHKIIQTRWTAPQSPSGNSIYLWPPVVIDLQQVTGGEQTLGIL